MLPSLSINLVILRYNSHKYSINFQILVNKVSLVSLEKGHARDVCVCICLVGMDVEFYLDNMFYWTTTEETLALLR